MATLLRAASLLLLLLLLAHAPTGALAQPVPQPTYANLTDGQPVLGFVAAGASAFFRFVAPLPMPRLDVVVVPLAGAPSLYLTLGRFWDPEPSNFLFASEADFGDELVSLPFNASAGVTTLGDTCNPRYFRECWVNVNVFGTRAANFSLTLTTAAGAGALVPGLPTVGLLPAGEADFYNLTVQQPAPALATFRVSSTPARAGAATPALLVSSTALGAPRPNASDPSSFCASSLAPSPLTGVTSVSVANTSACACAPGLPSCTYFVAAVNLLAPPPGSSGGGGSATAVAYSLVASTSSTAYTLLTDGVPALGAGAAGSPAAAYLFNAQCMAAGNATGRAEVVASPTSGTVVLYAVLGAAAVAAGVAPGPGSPFVFASPGGPGPQAVSLSPGDPRWVAVCGADPAATCPVLIGVATSSPSSAFSVVARSAAFVQLAAGVPLADSAPAGGAAALFRFSIGVAVAGQPVLVSVASTAGDAALFVGCDSDNATTRPTGAPGSFIWSAAAAGEEDGLVVIAPGDPGACVPPCSYYVGIASANPARAVGFTVLARTNSTSAAPTVLALGEVLLDSVAPGGASFFSLAWPADALGAPAESVDVAAFSTAGGGVALSARLDNASTGDAAPYAAPPAGPGEWQTLTVAVGDAAWNASAGCGGAAPPDLSGCAVAVVVACNATAAEGPSSFLITAAAGLTQLVDGVVVEASAPAAPASMRYFRYRAADATPFTVSLAVLSGEADLFVAAGARPNASWAQWSSRNAAASFVNVQWTEPWLRGSTFPTDFYVGVAGFNGAAAFSLVVSSNGYLELSPGVPLAAEASAGVLQTFLLYVPPVDAATGAAVGFSVALSPVSGDASPRIYINTVNRTQPCAHCGWPYCRTTPCDPANVASYNRRWSSEEATPNPLFCEVDAMDANYESGTTYVIAVLAAVDSSFSVVASFSAGTTYLLDQVPTPGSVADGAYAFFVVDILNVDVQLLAFLTISTGRADLFASANSTNRRPTAERHDKAALAGAGGSEGVAQALSFDWPELPECPGSSVQQTISCNGYFSVRGATGDNSSSAFTIVADVAKQNNTAFLLEDGVHITGVVKPADYEEFYAPLSLAAGTPFSVSLTPFGVAKLVLYLTLDGTRPGPTNFLLRTNGNMGPETISVLPDAPYYNASAMLRTVVHCAFLGWVGFDIVLESSASSTLRPAVPLVGSVQVTWAKFYSLAFDPSTSDSVDVTFTGLGGNRAVFAVGVAPPANATWRPSFGPQGSDANTCFVAALSGSSSRYAAMRAPSGRGACSALCAASAPGAPPASCVFVVGVSCPGIPYKEPPCSFVLSATTASTQAVQLNDGQPLYSVVSDAARPYRYFSLDVSLLLTGALGNLSLSAAPLASGSSSSVQLLATNVPGALPAAGAGGSVWSSGASNGSTTLVIAAADPALQACSNCSRLTFAVYAPSAPRLPPEGLGVLVTAETDAGTPTRLLLGQPSQPTTVNYRGVAQYVVFLQDPSVDLLFDLSVILGLLAFSVDPAQMPQCVVGVAPARVIRCSGLWTVANAGVAGPLRIAAGAPCANANASLPCSPAAAWRPGPYFVETIAFYSPTTHILTATQPGLVVSLVDGQPQQAAASSDSPALFSFATAGGGEALPLLVTLAAQARAVGWYLASCRVAQCSSAQLAPGPASPPGVVLLSGRVDAGGSAQVFVRPGDEAYCGATACLYVISVYSTEGSCPADTCSAIFSIEATLHGAPPPPLPPPPAAPPAAGVSAATLAAGGAGLTAFALAAALAAVYVRRQGCGRGRRRGVGDAGLLVVAEDVESPSLSGRASPLSTEELASHRAAMREARVGQLRASLGSTPSSTPTLAGRAAGSAQAAPPHLSLNAASEGGYSPPALTK